MKQTFKSIFCVLTICAMVSFYGCAKADKAGSDAGAGTGDTSQTEGGENK